MQFRTSLNINSHRKKQSKTKNNMPQPLSEMVCSNDVDNKEPVWIIHNQMTPNTSFMEVHASRFMGQYWTMITQ